MTDKQSDIVAELRAAAKEARKHAEGFPPSLRLAAERMRDLAAATDRAADELERLRASNKAMRRALEEIRSGDRMFTPQAIADACLRLSHSATKETAE